MSIDEGDNVEKQPSPHGSNDQKSTVIKLKVKLKIESGGVVTLNARLDPFMTYSRSFLLQLMS